MARISKKNPRYRTKKEICEDLSVILQSPITVGTKIAVVNEVLWVWSEFNGKYQGCQWWSKESLRTFKNQTTGFIHEHVVPKKLMRESLMSLKNLSPESIHHYLETHCIGVVVTKEEDIKLNKAGLNSKMPVDWDGKDVWARYQAVGIKKVAMYA